MPKHSVKHPKRLSLDLEEPGKVNEVPELPEVETVRRGLAPVMEGMVIEAVTLNRPDLRMPFPKGFARRLSGQKIVSLGRRAKYLTADLGSGDMLILHLGMSGSFRVEEETVAGKAFHMPRGKQAAHDHVVFLLSSGSRVIYNDPRRFGFMDLISASGIETYPAFSKLGPEPVGNHLSGPVLAERLAGKKVNLKAALLDQQVIAGLGNIYVCEALNRARLSPERLALTLQPEECELLASLIRTVIAEAIDAGGSTLKDYMKADGSLGYFQHSFRVYDREGEACRNPDCHGMIGRMTQGGRSTFFCAECQR